MVQHSKEGLWGIFNGIEASWGEETSYCPEEWHKGNVTKGQCAATAILLQELLGGELLRGWAIWDGNRERHYWNRVGKKQIDLTRKQFPLHVIIIQEELCTRNMIVENEWMEQRVNNLKKNYEQYTRASSN